MKVRMKKRQKAIEKQRETVFVIKKEYGKSPKKFPRLSPTVGGIKSGINLL